MPLTTPQPDDEEFHAAFARLLALPRAQRPAALDAVCAGDPSLRRRIERLLALAEDNEGFLDRSPLIAEPPPAVAGPAYAAGRAIGAYRLLRRLGMGGMAEVWLAERIEGGFHQQAAIKLIPHAPGPATERFAVEREILASLNHPGIARLYDGGIEPGGLAYMVMEYVEGEHLVAWCHARKLPLVDRLMLFLQVCDAVAYAHTRLVVHRDIKPANILVTADGQAKLLDFGIARLLGDDPADAAGRATRTLQLSPSYAAPEQLGGQLVGTATDVYALGVTLYELLAGQLPWTSEATPMATAMRRLLAAEPPPPSRAAADAAVPARALRGDIDAIVARALRREPGQRYPDARALAEDIRRHLEHRPVQARVGARGYVVRRYLRRHWRGLALAAAVFLAMSAALVAIAWQAEKARLEARRAAAVQAFMVDLFRANAGNQPDPVKARQTTARELLDTGVKRIDTQLNDAPGDKLALLRVFADLYQDFALADEEASLRRQVVAQSRRVNGADSPELAGDLVKLAWAMMSLDRDDAERQLDEASAILDRRRDAHSFLRGRLLAASAGNLYTTDPRRARDEAGRAVAILGQYPASLDLAEALRTQGMAETNLGNFTRAVPPLRRAVDVLVEADGPHDPNLSTYYRQLAQTASYAQQHATAIAAARQAIAYARAEGAEHDDDLVRAQTVMAEALVNAEQPRDSLAYVAQAKAVAPAASRGADAVVLDSYVLSVASRAQSLAGMPEAALADADAALDMARTLNRGDGFLAGSLRSKADVLAELRPDEAGRVLEEGLRVRQRMGLAPTESQRILRIRIALDGGRVADARAGFDALPPLAGGGLEATARTIHRRLAEAEIQLAELRAADAARTAAAATAQARASELAPYLRSTIADGELVEGRARVRDGDAAGARPLLADALALREALLLPQSPRIAEAQLALAEDELALGQRDEAAGLTARAEAIMATHGPLPARYAAPLQRLRAGLAKR